MPALEPEVEAGYILGVQKPKTYGLSWVGRAVLEPTIGPVTLYTYKKRCQDIRSLRECRRANLLPSC